MSPQASPPPSLIASAAPCPSSFSHFYLTHSLWDSHTFWWPILPPTPSTHADTRCRTQARARAHASFFVAFADIKTEKAAGSMQNNEVKAILIRLGMSPAQGGQEEWEMRKKRIKREKHYSRTNKAVAWSTKAVWLVFLAPNVPLSLRAAALSEAKGLENLQVQSDWFNTRNKKKKKFKLDWHRKYWAEPFFFLIKIQLE